MNLLIHSHAEADLDRHFERDETGVAYLDSIIALISEQERLKDKLSAERYAREYEQPIGLLGMEIKRIGSLWQQNIHVMRLRLDDESVLDYRIIYTVLRQKQVNQTYRIELWILAVIHKNTDQFDYQPNHVLMERIKNDYAQLHT